MRISSIVIILVLATLFSPRIFAEEPQTKQLKVDEWLLELTLPSKAVSTLDAANDRLLLELGWEHTAWLKLRPLEALEDEAAVGELFSQHHSESDPIIKEELNPEGLSYRVVEEEVRVGMPGGGGGGRQRHMLATVSRLFARFPLNDQHEIFVIFYLERSCSGLVCKEFLDDMAILKSMKAIPASEE